MKLSILEENIEQQPVQVINDQDPMGVSYDSNLPREILERQIGEFCRYAADLSAANNDLDVGIHKFDVPVVLQSLHCTTPIELVGGNKSHLAPLQTTITRVSDCSLVARLSTAIGPLLVETGIGSLLTCSLVSRVRLLERSVTKKTPINVICSGTDNDVFTLNVQGQLVRSQRWFWSRRTKQLYRNRYWLTPQVRPKTVKQRHSFALMETLRTSGDSASLQKYVTRQFL
ncbi:hypothetical protein BASA83_004848 [Batrachochytrium salamandrivorans]|nr:hypothetical protein BASA83_004848 [Batrachochytrium salamandrivorans]